MKESRFTKQLDHVTREDFVLLGGKGANLGEMLKAGLPVPGGFVILTNGYQSFVEANGLDKEINSILSGMDKDKAVELKEAAAKI